VFNDGTDPYQWVGNPQQFAPNDEQINYNEFMIDMTFHRCDVIIDEQANQIPQTKKRPA
jgi:hypothetical protein